MNQFTTIVIFRMAQLDVKKKKKSPTQLKRIKSSKHPTQYSRAF